MLEKEISVRSLQLDGHVGFDSLPDQQVSKSVQKGFVFNILCIGETGIGKSTLMESLFNTSFESSPSDHDMNSVTLKSRSYELWEKNVQMKLTVVDTVGYGDQVNKEESFKAIINYIDLQFEAYLQEELRLERCLSMYHDTRIHACLYFISPTGHGLKSIDLECMKQLGSKVNVIPLIAKADAISKSELKQFKEKIMTELASSGVVIYQFPTDDETIAENNGAVNSQLPFAVVGSRELVRVGNKMMRARQYPWGIVQVENETHCDTAKLREMLIRTNMEDLRDQTHMRHYELFRKSRLEQMGFTDDTVNSDNTPISFHEACEVRMRLHLDELAQKEEDMRQKFVVRIQDKEAELRENERKLHEQYEQLKEEHNKEKEKMEDYRKQLDDEIAEFEKLTLNYENELSPSKKQSSGFHHTFSLGSLKGKKK